MEYWFEFPHCCYSIGALYADGHDGAESRVPAAASEDEMAYAHRDRAGRIHRYGYRGGMDQLLVGAAGTATGLVGFGIGVLGVSHLVLRRVPIRIAVGTSHFVILLVTGVAVGAHLFEIVSRGESPPWNVIAANVTAVLVGGQLAAWLASRLPEHGMRQILVTLLLALSAVTPYRDWTLL